MCPEGWGGIEQMELVWIKDIRARGKSPICPYNLGKQGAPLRHMGGPGGLFRSRGHLWLLPSSLVYRCWSVTTPLKAAFPRFSWNRGRMDELFSDFTC